VNARESHEKMAKTGSNVVWLRRLSSDSDRCQLKREITPSWHLTQPLLNMRQTRSVIIEPAHALLVSCSKWAWCTNSIVFVDVRPSKFDNLVQTTLDIFVELNSELGYCMIIVDETNISSEVDTSTNHTASTQQILTRNKTVSLPHSMLPVRNVVSDVTIELHSPVK
jgi:hypothetical protein